MSDSHSPRLLLAIESTCDETAAAIIDDDLKVLSSVIASQANLHERYGGVVPEIASRAHVEQILPVIAEALQNADCDLSDLHAVAVANQPGLVGSLLVGLTAAKSLAFSLEIPLLTVNHIEGHIFACRMNAGHNVFPAVGLVVSGGHSNLYDCHGSTRFELLGSTIDDAVGEAFDKVATLLGLPYPGGPSVEREARLGNPRAFRFPRTFLREDRLSFSFSGLKTAVRYAALGTPGSNRSVPELTEQRKRDLCASFQQAAVDVLVGKAAQAMRQCGRDSLCVGGGVAANQTLRAALQQMTDENGWKLFVAPTQLCTDNAAMAAIAWELLEGGQAAELDVDVVPGLVRAS